jgi:predicted amino acid-binding ACT domain protein
MEISEDDIRLITRLVAEKLGPNASPEKVRPLVAEAIEQLSSAIENVSAITLQSSESIHTLKNSRLIINAFGLAKGNIEENLRAFIITNKLPLIALSLSNIEEFASLIAIIDYSNFKTDINRLKFEISELCEKLGFKAIIQDSAYYGI